MEEPLRRYSFDFRELAPRASRPLRVVEAETAPVPPGATWLAPPRRPGFLRPILPAIRSGRPLRVAVRWEAAPAFGARLRDVLAGIYAAAGAGVLLLDDGFVVGFHDLPAIPARAGSELVAAELWPGSVALALAGLAGLGSRGRLVLNGALPRLDGRLGVPPALAAEAVRLPFWAPRELAASAGGGLPAGRFGRACVALAAALGRRHLEAEP